MAVNPFYWFFLFLVGLQRLAEVAISKRHTRWIQAQGGREFGQAHFKWVVLLMGFFFVSIPVESFLRQTQLVAYWPALFLVFLLAQALRYWAMFSLGNFWNVRIWILPGAKRVVGGPYRYFRHPNYVAVLLELLVIPWMIACYWTAALSILGFLFFLKVRLEAEEKALALLNPEKSKV